MEFRRLKSDEIDVKVGSVTKSGYTLLLYKNARVDMAILDETVGMENWQRDHKEVKGNLYCGIGLNVNYADSNKEPRWIWKWDCGVESAFGDKEKGESSDAFKRSGFCFGIGRELYTSPFIFISCETKYDETKKVWKIASVEEQKRSQYMRVKEIAYNDKGEISKLVIVDSNGIQVYPKPKENIEMHEIEEEIIGGAFVLKGGKYNGKTIQEVLEQDEGYIRWCIVNGKNINVKKNMEKALADNGLSPVEIEA